MPKHKLPCKWYEPQAWRPWQRVWRQHQRLAPDYHWSHRASPDGHAPGVHRFVPRPASSSPSHRQRDPKTSMTRRGVVAGDSRGAADARGAARAERGGRSSPPPPIPAAMLTVLALLPLYRRRDSPVIIHTSSDHRKERYDLSDHRVGVAYTCLY